MMCAKEFSKKKLGRAAALGALLTFVLGDEAPLSRQVRASTGVQALFDLTAPAGGPFPSDWFTVVDPSHNTGRRVNLPSPDCEARRSDCEDLAVLNTLDGFNLQPRLSLPFDGPIDVSTVTSNAVFLISLGSTLDHGGDPPGTVVGINQIVWDTLTHTLHVESDELLAQHTRYALIVTNGVRGADGNPVEASEEFRRFRLTGPHSTATTWPSPRIPACQRTRTPSGATSAARIRIWSGTLHEVPSGRAPLSSPPTAT